MQLISVVTPCYNEEENVIDIYERVKEVFTQLPNYQYEHIFIDNDSNDRTIEILKALSKMDENIKIIRNSRNFGWTKSSFYGLLQAQGDAVILIAADSQEPPVLIKTFIQEWESGFQIVIGVKPKSQESKIMFAVRKSYYRFLKKISEVSLVENFTGFGLYDRKIIQTLKTFNEPEPFFRGMVSEVGFEIKKIPYLQPKRQKGSSKFNLYKLYDLAMLGITSHSKLPLRMATFIGFFFSGLSFLLAITYFIVKILFWHHFSVGVASIAIGLFFLGSVQLFCVGLIGEYMLLLNSRMANRPLVIEKERIGWK